MQSQTPPQKNPLFIKRFYSLMHFAIGSGVNDKTVYDLFLRSVGTGQNFELKIDDILSEITFRASKARRYRSDLNIIAERLSQLRTRAEAYQALGQNWIATHKPNLECYTRKNLLDIGEFLKIYRNTVVKYFMQNLDMPLTKQTIALVESTYHVIQTKVKDRTSRKFYADYYAIRSRSIVTITPRQVLENKEFSHLRIMCKRSDANYLGIPYLTTEDGDYFVYISVHHKIRLHQFLHEQNLKYKRWEDERKEKEQNASKEVSAEISKIFPLISMESANSIAEYACKYKGDTGLTRIGLAHDVSLSDRAFYAVWAHLRHAQTDYSYLLWEAANEHRFNDDDFIGDEYNRCSPWDRYKIRLMIRPQMDRLVKDLGCTYQPTQNLDGYYSEVASIGKVE